jgi:phage major head subunit gpT-like protein
MKRILLITMLLLVASLPVVASVGIDPASGTGRNVDPTGFMLLFGAGAVGLVVNAQSIAGLYKSFNTIFNEAMAAAKPQYLQVAMVVPSTTKENAYVWLGAWPKMREWLGERFFHKLKAYDYSIKNKKFETSVEIEEDDIEDDNYGIYRPMVQSMGYSAQMHPDELVFALLNNAFTALGYDGKAFFATDHASGGNKATAALSSASYKIAKAALGRVKDSQGNSLFAGSERDLLVVGPELEETARTLLNADYISVSGGSTQNNPWKNSADLLVTPQITSATAWFLLRPFGGLKPLIFQIRRSVRFVTKDDPQTSDQVFLRGKYAMGADARYNAGYGLHQLAYGSTGAA